MLTQRDFYGRSPFVVNPIQQVSPMILTNHTCSLNKGQKSIARTVAITKFFDDVFKFKYSNKDVIDNDYSFTNYEYGSYSTTRTSRKSDVKLMDANGNLLMYFHVPIRLDNIAPRGNLYSSAKLFSSVVPLSILLIISTGSLFTSNLFQPSNKLNITKHKINIRHKFILNTSGPNM